MIITNTELAKVKTSLTEEKKFIGWMIDIDHTHDSLLALDEFDLMTIIAQGRPNVDTKEFEQLFLNSPYSEERERNINNMRKKLGLDNNDSSNNKTSENKNTKSNKKATDKKPEDNTSKLIESLKTIDKLDLGSILSDKEAINSIINGKIDKLWNALFIKEITLDRIKSEINKKNKSLRFFSEIIERFIKEYDIVNKYEPPVGYSAHTIDENGNAIPTIPNLMQKLYVNRLFNKKYYANWSGMGSGKTLAFIIASREIDARLTVIVVVNGTEDQWEENILNAYPDSVVYNGHKIKDYDQIDFDYSKQNYVIIPYSRFSLKAESFKLDNLSKKKIDFIGCDEVHTVKSSCVKHSNTKNSSDNNVESIRRENMKRFVKLSQLNNPNIYRTIMTGTPVVNNLDEPKSLLNILLQDEFSDIHTNYNKQNSIKLYQLLTLHGVRFTPKYDDLLIIKDGSTNKEFSINFTDRFDEFTKLKRDNDVFKFTLEGKLKAVSKYITPGTTIFTRLTTGIINKICDHVTKLGFTYSLYTGENEGERKDELKKFINEETDILIASSPVSTGIDGLQHRCHRLIALTLPYTSAVWEQLINRFYRQGGNHDVEVIIPQAYLNVNGEEWSWDKTAYNRIKFKKSLSDWVLDGIINTTTSIDKLWKESKISLVNLKNRLDKTIFERVHEDLIVSDNSPEDIKPRNYSHITNMNEKGRHYSSDKMHEYIIENPDKFIAYQKDRLEDILTNWDENPCEIIEKRIKNKNQIVADFGCGMNLLNKHLENTVYGFDHYVCADGVIACNMKNVPLNNESVDIAVFSLSLWGTKYDIDCYFKEAYRILTYGGQLYIAEPRKKYNDEKINLLIEQLSKIGFTIIGKVDKHETFFYINMIKN